MLKKHVHQSIMTHLLSNHRCIQPGANSALARVLAPKQGNGEQGNFIQVQCPLHNFCVCRTELILLQKQTTLQSQGLKATNE